MVIDMNEAQVRSLEQVRPRVVSLWQRAEGDHVLERLGTMDRELEHRDVGVGEHVHEHGPRAVVETPVGSNRRAPLPQEPSDAPGERDLALELRMRARPPPSQARVSRRTAKALLRAT